MTNRINAEDVGAGVDEKLIQKLLQIKAIMDRSTHEGEVANAASLLEKLLTEHNLSIGELESRGGKAAPGVIEQVHDLGKAAFQWKLNLASVVAGHYFCYAYVHNKTVQFIGRPDNVEAMQMLYGWLIDQIKRISADERRKWEAENSEHIDPLRWQVNFGIGCVERLGTRLKELKAQQAADVGTMALVLHHESEISDYMEGKYGRRVDGKRTKAEEEWFQRREAEKKAKEELREKDIEEFYRQYPKEHPDAIAKAKAETDAYWAEVDKKEARNARRRTGRRGPAVDWEKEEQASSARYAGRAAAANVNLQPFIKGGNAGKPAGEIR